MRLEEESGKKNVPPQVLPFFGSSLSGPSHCVSWHPIPSGGSAAAWETRNDKQLLQLLSSLPPQTTIPMTSLTFPKCTGELSSPFQVLALHTREVGTDYTHYNIPSIPISQ